MVSAGTVPWAALVTHYGSVMGLDCLEQDTLYGDPISSVVVA